MRANGWRLARLPAPLRSCLAAWRLLHEQVPGVDPLIFGEALPRRRLVWRNGRARVLQRRSIGLYLSRVTIHVDHVQIINTNVFILARWRSHSAVYIPAVATLPAFGLIFAGTLT
jgi:hypothetical protein